MFLKLTQDTCWCMRSSSAHVTSSLHPPPNQPTVMRSLLQPTAHRATQQSLHLRLVQDIAAERGQFQNQDYWSVREDGQTENCIAAVGCVCACLQSGTQIATIRCAVCSVTVCKMHCAGLFLCLSLWIRKQSNPFLCGSQFKN